MSTRAPARRRPAQTRSTTARKPIDPRIRDRRVAVLRAQGRRRLRWLIGLIVLGTLAAMAWLVTHSALLDVERVRVTGAQHATPAEVRSAAGVEDGDPILFVDTGAVENDVERVAWIDRARVERSLSGQLDIHVTERLPAAWVRRTPEQVALVDTRGRVLADPVAPPPDLPEVAGLTGVPLAGREITPAAAVGVLDELPAELRGRTVRVVVQGEDVTLALRDGPEVQLGTPERVAAKARATLAVLSATAGAPLRYIDVRVPGAPVTG
jgi:cell division protein FtsQ